MFYGYSMLAYEDLKFALLDITVCSKFAQIHIDGNSLLSHQRTACDLDLEMVSF